MPAKLLRRAAIGGTIAAFLLTPVLPTSHVQGAPAGMRSIFLNGIDISSARNEDLKNVDLHINENGDIFIVAPHYQVNEEDTYVPLAKFLQNANTPTHKPAAPIGTSQPAAANTPANASAAMLPKAGTPAPVEAATQGAEPPPPLPGDEAVAPPSETPSTF